MIGWRGASAWSGTVVVVLALVGCGGAAAPEPEAVDNGPLGDYFDEALGTSEFGRLAWDSQ